MNKELAKSSNFFLYTTLNGDVRLDVFLQDETLWLTQKMMAELFEIEPHTITYHIKEIYQSGELKENSTHRKIRAVQVEGSRQISREFDYYNLDVIVAVLPLLDRQRRKSLQIRQTGASHLWVLLRGKIRQKAGSWHQTY